MNCLSSFHLLSFRKRNWCLDDFFHVWLCPKMIYFQKNFHSNRLDRREEFPHWKGWQTLEQEMEDWPSLEMFKSSVDVGHGLVVTTTMILDGFSSLTDAGILCQKSWDGWAWKGHKRVIYTNVHYDLIDASLL